MFLQLFALASLCQISIASLEKEAEQCGTVQKTHRPLIYEGIDSSEAEWPWHSAIYVSKTSSVETRIYQCGGTLISRSSVLTAAHCTIQDLIPLPKESLTVRLGTHLLNTTDPNVKFYGVKKIIRHGRYDATYYQYDIALLKTVDQVEFSDYIQPICLPSGSVVESFESGVVIGWGLGIKGQLEQVLQKATLGYVKDEICLYSDDLYHVLKSKDNSNFCAGNANKTNVCDGDSGGGMFLQNKQDKQWYIRGIVSARANSELDTRCDPKRYVIFSNVTFFNDWIEKVADDETTNLLGLDDCAEDNHDRSVPEDDKPIFLQYPWVTVQEYSVENQKELQTICSGVLIHPRFVLSTGHCVCDSCEQVKLKSIRLGDYDLSGNPDSDADGDAVNFYSIPVDKVIHHPNANILGYNYNIALIKLSQSAPVGKDNIKPICLQKAASLATEFSVVGWKRTGDNVLQREITRIQEGGLCKQAYDSINVDIDPEESFVCVDRMDSSSSTNDCYSFKSGSSLHYLEEVEGTNRYYLKGLFAFGSSRCSLKLPDVFLNVDYYLNWIKETVEIELRN